MADPVGHRKRTIISEYDPLIASENEKKCLYLCIWNIKEAGLQAVKKEGSTSYVKTYEKQTLRTDPEQTQLLKSRLRADTNQTRGQLLRFALVLGCVRSILFFLSALSLFFRFLIGLIFWNGHTLHLRAAIKWNGRKYGQCNQLKHIWPPSWWLVLERCQVQHCIICICYYRKQKHLYG